MAKILVDFDISIVKFNLLNSDEINSYIKDNNFRHTESFVSRNYIFIVTISFLLKLINFVNTFLYLDQNQLKFFSELIISFIPSFLFLMSAYLTFKSYENKFDKKIILFGIFLFFFSSYLLNFLSSHFFAEATILFLISLRIYLKEKKVNLIYLSIIDFLLIKIRVTCYVIVAYFIISELFKNKTKFKSYLIYLIIVIFLSVFYNYFSFQTDEKGIVGRILKSACIFDESVLNIFLDYLYKVYLSYFSLNVGIIFGFPLFILFIYNLLKNLSSIQLILKFLTIGLIISLFALEEFWFLPAGFSGHRGIAPFLIIIFPNILLILKSLLNKNKKITLFFGFFLYLLYFPSLDYRNTMSLYSMCGSINEPCVSFFTMFQKELDHLYYAKDKYGSAVTCRHPNLFTHTDIRMHPGIFGWRVILSKINSDEKIKIYFKKTDGLKEKFNYTILNNNYKKGYFDQNIIHFIPHTMISRVSYVLNLKLELKSDKKIINNYDFNTNIINVLNYFTLAVVLFYIIFPIYFFLRRFKVI